MRIGKKTIHSVIIGLAMALPILYLGGSMIAGLAGAHGEQLWSEMEDKNYSYTVGTLQNRWLDGTTGEVNFINGAIISDYFPILDVHNLSLSFSNVPDWLYFYDSDFSYLSRSGYANLTSIPIETSYFRTGIYSNPDMFDSWTAYYSYPVSNPVISSLNYSDYLFGNFFPKDNFVERIGQNALSENPKGFAPFGTMLSYLDDNMFHAGDSQTALMVYGMVYWSLHVVLADLVYHVLVFVPNLINRVFDWFGQKGVSDE